MKLITQFVTGFILLCSSVVSHSASNEYTVDEINAIESVNNYLASLIAGDLHQASEFLAPKLVKQRQSLFNNPNYPAQLRQAYTNATYEIIALKTLKAGKIQIDVKIDLNQQDVVHSRFILANINRLYRIIVEQ